MGNTAASPIPNEQESTSDRSSSPELPPRPPSPPQRPSPSYSKFVPGNPTPPPTDDDEEEFDYPCDIVEIPEFEDHEMEEQVEKFVTAEKNALTLDLVIVMDCTFSMQPWLDAWKSHITEIINSLGQKFADNATIRVGFVAYRDFDSPTASQPQSIPLTSDMDKVLNFIAGQTIESSTSYSDIPEDLIGGLQVALHDSMGWKSTVKLVVVVTDAPCHGRQYHPCEVDHFPNGKEGQPTIEAQMGEMVKKGIEFVMIDIGSYKTELMISKMQSAYNAAIIKENDKNNASASSTKSSGNNNVLKFTNITGGRKVGSQEAADTLVETLGKAAEASLSASAANALNSESKKAAITGSDGADTGTPATGAVGGDLNGANAASTTAGKVSANSSTIPEKSKAPQKIEDETSSADKEEFDWANLKATRYTYWANTATLTKTELVTDPVNCLKIIKHHAITLDMDRDAFTEGKNKVVHRFMDKSLNKPMAAKFYKESDLRTLENYQRDVQMQYVAKVLAKEFSKHPKSIGGIDFLTASYYELENPPSEDMKYFVAEPFVEGEFVEYNDDLCDAKARVHTAFSEIVQAFCHFTWEYTESRLYIIHMQGVNNIGSSPKILGARKQYWTGGQDIGKVKSGLFFRKHQCNQHCQALGLATRNALMRHYQNPIPVPPTGYKNVELSCELCCGSVFTKERKFHMKDLVAKAGGRQIYCPECVKENQKVETTECTKCKSSFTFLPHWYNLKGLDPPKKCQKCK